MNVNSVTSTTYSYQATQSASVSKTTTNTTTNKKPTTSAKDTGVVYDKNSNVDRESIINKLKADSEQHVNQLKSMVTDMMKQQGKHIGTGDEDGLLRFLAGGNFTVTAAAKAQAQEAISEDGYWGVNQTSDRIVDFAKALSGGDPEKADKLFAAFEKGFKEATKSWGKDLPQISNDTYDAVKQKFDDWKNGTN